MSIVACVKVYDGLALGAESMTQLLGQVPGSQQPQFMKAYGNARKLFEIRTRPLGVGVLTYGAGNIGPRSVGSFIEEYAETVGPKENVADIAKGLRDHIQKEYQVQFGALPINLQPATGFYVAGYSPDAHVGEELEFIFPKGDVTSPRPTGYGASWRGVPIPFARLYTGVDARLFSVLPSLGISPEVIAKVQQEAAKLVSPIAFDGMPVQDAIGFCKFILETTIGVCTYELGVPSCGGPLHLAVITKRDGFVWVTKPKYEIQHT